MRYGRMYCTTCNIDGTEFFMMVLLSKITSFQRNTIMAIIEVTAKA